MQLKTTSRTLNIYALQVSAGVRYWEDATVNGVKDEGGKLIPFRNGNYWQPVIELDSGRVLDWPNGVEAKIHYKVCDDGEYTLVDFSGSEVGKCDGYVPKIMCPEENGFGDYIIMNINSDGLISNWLPTLRDFEVFVC